MEEDFNVPITVAGFSVSPNDLVLADGSGVAFIAAAEAEEVLQTAEMVAAREARMKEAVLKGDSVVEVMGRDYEQMLQR
jgi:regulator of RNase E activity RraA